MGEKELPDGWVETTLGEVTDQGTYGWTTKAKETGGVRFLRTTDISRGPIDWSSVPFCETVPEDISKFILREGDVLISRSGSIGVNVLIRKVPESTVFASYLIRFRTKPGIVDFRYLSHFLASPSYWESIREGASGNAMQNINAKKLSTIKIPLAPLPEQRRIADKLDTLLARLEACREHLDRVPALLKRFRQSVLAAATSGRLTEDWREANGVSGEWEECTLGEVVLELRNGIAARPDENPDGTQILRISAIRPGFVDTSDVRRIRIPLAEAEKYSLRKGDVIFTRYNGTLEFVGVCGVVRNTPGSVVYPDKLMRARVNASRVKPEFIEALFESERARLQVEGFIKSSAGQKGISGTDLKSVRFTLPSLPEQQEIAKMLEQQISWVKMIEKRYEKAQARLSEVVPATLGKAFCGELN